METGKDIDTCRMTFEEAYTKYRKAVIKVCRHFSKDETFAEDLCQEVFIKYFLNKPKSDIKWLSIVAKRHGLEHNRVWSQRGFHSPSDLRSLPASPITDWSLLRYLELASPKGIKVFYDNEIGKMPHKQIAAKYGISESTSRNHLMKMRKDIKRLLSN